MVEVVNTIYKGNDTSDVANNCRCVCSTDSQRKEAKDWMWLPWNSCGCACNGTTANSTANSNMSKG